MIKKLVILLVTVFSSVSLILAVVFGINYDTNRLYFNFSTDVVGQTMIYVEDKYDYYDNSSSTERHSETKKLNDFINLIGENVKPKLDKFFRSQGNRSWDNFNYLESNTRSLSNTIKNDSDGLNHFVYTYYFNSGINDKNTNTEDLLKNPIVLSVFYEIKDIIFSLQDKGKAQQLNFSKNNLRFISQNISQFYDFAKKILLTFLVLVIFSSVILCFILGFKNFLPIIFSFFLFVAFSTLFVLLLHIEIGQFTFLALFGWFLIFMINLTYSFLRFRTLLKRKNNYKTEFLTKAELNEIWHENKKYYLKKLYIIESLIIIPFLVGILITVLILSKMPFLVSLLSTSAIIFSSLIFFIMIFFIHYYFFEIPFKINFLYCHNIFVYFKKKSVNVEENDEQRISGLNELQNK
ncbi:hypothetical protein JTY60_02580 [symbiont of Argiope bruennichi]|uniref:hypothetical protein n=1 Tax=symbiont of Argiope bruennichi TaxID=2810479 RepID=UPI003DA367B3